METFPPEGKRRVSKIQEQTTQNSQEAPETYKIQKTPLQGYSNDNFREEESLGLAELSKRSKEIQGNSFHELSPMR